MNYQETLNYLYTRLPMYQRVGAAALKFNLDNITLLMERLGNPQDKVKTVHVAGTNGKGSSAHMIASILQESGYKTGLHTSPHLKSFTERIRINGSEIAPEAVVAFVEAIRPLIEEIEPSFFEIAFAMAMKHFENEVVDIAVIEVGMGGRLDSTNIIQPEVSLITNISMDHQQFLGDTLPAIATEKAGIIKPYVPVVISETQTEIAHVFIEIASSLNSPIVFADQQFRIEQAAGDRINVVYKDDIVYEGVLPDLRGGYQVNNIPGVLGVVDCLVSNNWTGISENSINSGLENVIVNTGLKGRWQILRSTPLTITDTGHNEAGIKYIIDGLLSESKDQLHIVWGMVSDKDPRDVLSLLPKEAVYYFVAAQVPRALSVDELKTHANKLGLVGDSYPSVMAGYRAAQDNAKDDDLLFIGGSTFVVAEIEDL